MIAVPLKKEERHRQKVCSHCHCNQYCSPIPKTALSHHSEFRSPPFFLFYSLSESPSISIALLFWSLRHWMPITSFLLFVLFAHIFRTCPNPFFSLFSLPSVAALQTTGAKEGCVLMCLCEWWIAVSHFIDGKCRLIAIFKAFTYVKIHCEKHSRASPLTHVIRPWFKQPAAAPRTRS